MYFSRISLRRESSAATRSVHQLLRDKAYEHHQLIWRFFPASPGSPRDFLFRYMQKEDCFYTVSKRPPQAPDDAWDMPPAKPYDPQIVESMVLYFDLRANPVVTRERDGKGRRDDIVMHAKKKIMQTHGVSCWGNVPVDARKPLYELTYEAGIQWLTAVGERNGFEVLPDSIQVDGYLRHHYGAKERTICFSTVDFGGALVVTDAEKFRLALFQGIGHAKGFGCGLMLVRRP